MRLGIEIGDALDDCESAIRTVMFEHAEPILLPPAKAGAATNADEQPPGRLAETVVDVLDTPRVRGWIHFASAVVAIIASAALVRVAFTAASPDAGWATTIYTATIIAMFGVSATYHLVRWRSSKALMWMKRADHSMIFIFIVGTYTPVAVLAMPPRTATQVLTIVCVGAAAGIALKVLWPSAPRWIGLPLYLMLGYAAIGFAEHFSTAPD